MRIKTSKLTGAAFDWAVANCEGYFTEQPEYWASPAGIAHFVAMRGEGVDWTRSSTDWSQGGPIIERERIAVQFGPQWTAVHNKRLGRPYYGPTPLIAAMRCRVASKLGDEVEIPQELLTC